MKSVLFPSLRSPILAVLLVFLWACGGSSSSEQSSDAAEEFAAAKDEITGDIDQYIKDLPPPSEVPFLLMATGSDFNPNLVNSPDNADNYVTIDKAALNLGVYATDIGYLSSYDQSDAVFSTVETCRRLAETIDVASAIDIDLITRFEDNISQRDSLAGLTDEVMQATGERLQTLDRLNLAAVVLYGGFIEGLYISTQVIDTYPDDLLPETDRNLILEPLITIVIDQKKALEDLIKVMSEVETSPAVESITTDLNSIKAVYDNELGEVEENIVSNTGGYQLTKELISGLAAEVARIRAEIVR